MKEDLLKIINHYRVLPQLKQLNEEAYELIEAIRDYETSGWDFDYEDYKELEAKYRYHIEEEFADVMVMLEQFKSYYELDNDRIVDIMYKKIDRQLERLANDR